MPWNDNSNNNNGPWGGNRPGGGGRRPQSPWGGGNKPPDIEEVLKRFGGGAGKFFGGMGGPFLALILGLVALLGWGATGFVVVDQAERALVMRFGEYNRTLQPGFHIHLPFPIEQRLVENVTRTREIDIGPPSEALERFNLSTNQRGGETTQGRPTINEEALRALERTADYQDGLMLSGDENFVVVSFTIQYNIGDLRNYLFEIRDPEGAVRAVAESGMRELVGSLSYEEVSQAGRDVLGQDLRVLMQEVLDSYMSGVNILSVQLRDISYPPRVAEAFLDVAAADQDARAAINEATRYQNEQLPQARAEAEALLQEAQGYRERVVAEASGEADRFRQVYESYSASPDVTRRRLFLETMEEVLSKTDKVILESDAGSGVVPYLPLNQVRGSN